MISQVINNVNMNVTSKTNLSPVPKPPKAVCFGKTFGPDTKEETAKKNFKKTALMIVSFVATMLVCKRFIKPIESARSFLTKKIMPNSKLNKLTSEGIAETLRPKARNTYETVAKKVKNYFEGDKIKKQLGKIFKDENKLAKSIQNNRQRAAKIGKLIKNGGKAILNNPKETSSWIMASGLAFLSSTGLVKLDNFVEKVKNAPKEINKLAEEEKSK